MEEEGLADEEVNTTLTFEETALLLSHYFKLAFEEFTETLARMTLSFIL